MFANMEHITICSNANLATTNPVRQSKLCGAGLHDYFWDVTTAYHTKQLITGDGRVFSPGIVVIHNSGMIKYAGPPEGNTTWAHQNIEVDGALAPGFINAHTHIELSWMKGMLPQGLGLDGFIREVTELRSDSPELRKRRHAMDQARKEMIRDGVVAAGDICNGLSSLPVKKQGGIKWHNFVEVFGSEENKAEKHCMRGLSVFRGLEETGPTSLVPHSAYSVSPALLEKILGVNPASGGTISLHHLENPDELEYFMEGSGKIMQRLADMGIEKPRWIPAGKRPIEFLLTKIQSVKRLLLVHNTYAGKEDIRAVGAAPFPTTWVLCPEANLYIERRLPDVPLFRDEGLDIAIGTDSLASSSSLSVLRQLVLIQEHFPDIPASELLRWATYNGARALGMDRDLGRLKPGTRPGLLLINGIEGDRFSRRTKVRRLA